MKNFVSPTVDVFLGILTALQYRGTSHCFDATIDHKRYTFTGLRTSIANIQLVMIELCSKTSPTSPKDWHVDPEAYESLLFAVRNQIRTGRIFYTATRADWNWPSYTWAIDLREEE